MYFIKARFVLRVTVLLWYELIKFSGGTHGSDMHKFHCKNLSVWYFRDSSSFIFFTCNIIMYEFSYVTSFYGYIFVIILSVIYVTKHPRMHIVPKIVMSLMIGILIYILLSSQWGTYMRTSYVHRSNEPILPVGSGWSFFLDKGRRKGNI